MLETSPIDADTGPEILNLSFHSEIVGPAPDVGATDAPPEGGAPSPVATEPSAVVDEGLTTEELPLGTSDGVAGVGSPSFLREASAAMTKSGTMTGISLV